MGLNRLALHAGIVNITIDGQPMTIRSPLAPDLCTVFEQMDWWPNVSTILLQTT
jgi:hypothetical protein